MKEVMSRFFVNSLVTGNSLTFNSGIHLRTADCQSNGQAEVGFIGRVLLNAFNAWEYSWQCGREDLKENSMKVFDSYLKNGFTQAGFFKESVNFDRGYEDPVHSIRRQSEGVYAMLHFLAYERENGRRHPEWEQKMKNMLDILLQLQHEDGSFPRKFHDDFTIVDNSGGSTPSATLPLIMGYKYFKDKRYLASAKRTADYLEKVLISKADYFSSTLDANCVFGVHPPKILVILGQSHCCQRAEAVKSSANTSQPYVFNQSLPGLGIRLYTLSSHDSTFVLFSKTMSISISVSGSLSRYVQEPNDTMPIKPATIYFLSFIIVIFFN